MPLLGKGCEASRRWIAECRPAGIPGRGGTVPARGGAVPTRGGPLVVCDMAGEPALSALGIWGGLYVSEPFEFE